MNKVCNLCSLCERTRAGVPVLQLPAGGQGALRQQFRRAIPNQTAAAPASSPRQRGNSAATSDALVSAPRCTAAAGRPADDITIGVAGLLNHSTIIHHRYY